MNKELIEKKTQLKDEIKYLEEIIKIQQEFEDKINPLIFESYYKIKNLEKDISINIEVKTNYNKEELSQKLIYCVSEIAAELGYAGTSEEMKLWNDKTNEWIKNNL